MASTPRRLLAGCLLAAASLALGACGEEGIQLSSDDPNYRGAQLFNENCAGCHTLAAAGAQGSATDVGSRERKDGPNFDDRKETVESVLYAIRNGGFSSSPMPQNLVTGDDAQAVAEFVAKYSGGGGSIEPSNPGETGPASDEP
ncbi:MAG TPA: cytochrome c [Solirubrobacteraceae bacterium]|jgi:mono/diheme cytochrome c family protein|nr:cytochrome c [Solirubrobacteraceae bacterium]